ncbi:MAG: acyltransferase family protein [Candidatus Hermodarchaeota archaeon]
MDNRIVSIDVIRGLCVVLMVVGHMYYLWVSTVDYIPGIIIAFIIIIPSGVFPLVSGYAFYYYIDRENNKEIKKSKIFRVALMRAGFIFFISTTITFLFGFFIGVHPNTIIYWSIFQLIAVSMISFFFIPFLRIEFRMLSYLILSILIFFFCFIILNYEIKILYILFNVGNFPFLPWAIYFLFGIFIADLTKNFPENKISTLLLVYMSIGAIVITAFFLGISNVTYMYIDLFFKNIGAFLIIYPILYFFMDLKGFESSLQNRLIQWGKVAFSVYYLHFGLLVMGLFILPFIINDIFSNGLSLYQYFISATIILISIDIFLRLWKRYNYILGIEWAMSKFSKKSLFDQKTPESVL